MSRDPLLLLLLLPLLAQCAAARWSAAERPWLDWRRAAQDRAAALTRALSLQEKAAQLTSAAPRVDRLGVPAYHWRNNVLHGVVDNGVSTVFPQAIALGATWDAELLERSGLAWGLEQRSKYNAARRRSDGPPGSALRDSPMNFGLDLWYVVAQSTCESLPG
jgi:beta-glucosidase